MKPCHLWISQYFRLVSASLILVVLALSCTSPNRADTALPGMQVAQQPVPQVTSCCTRFGRCPLDQPQPLKSACYCGSRYGPVAGFACY
jgi:hypothetical protein